MSTEQAKGFRLLDNLDEAIKRRAYDCECQVGGVDAMSIDTDWLRYAAKHIRDEHRAVTERAEIAEARIRAVEDVLDAWDLRPGDTDFGDAIRRALEG